MDLLSRIRTLRDIESSACSSALIPGRFFIYAMEFLDQYIHEGIGCDILFTLLDEDNPVQICFALYCFSFLNQDKAKIIIEHLDDGRRVTIFPFGCIGSGISVKQFCQRLLENNLFLGNPLDFKNKTYHLFRQSY